MSNGDVRVDYDGHLAVLTLDRPDQLNAMSDHMEGRLWDAFEELEAHAYAQLEQDGIPRERMVIQRIADCRYLGQGYELRVDVPSGTVDTAWAAKVRADFDDIHLREYSRRFEEADVEIPNVRVRGIGLMPPLVMPEAASGSASPAGALRHEGEAWFRVDGTLEQVATRYYERAALKAGNRLEGPAIVNQYDSTTVIPPGTGLVPVHH